MRTFIEEGKGNKQRTGHNALINRTQGPEKIGKYRTEGLSQKEVEFKAVEIV